LSITKVTDELFGPFFFEIDGKGYKLKRGYLKDGKQQEDTLGYYSSFESVLKHLILRRVASKQDNMTLKAYIKELRTFEKRIREIVASES